jgi:uncharacterized protein YbjT (DUF2867 family)
MRHALIGGALALVALSGVQMSVVSVPTLRRPPTLRSIGSRMSDSRVGRRDFATFGVAAGTIAVLGGDARPALAASPTVFVAGATGKTGRLVCRLLCERGGSIVIAGVRNEPKARELGLLCASLKHFDVSDPVDEIAASLNGVSSVVCALGFVPGNPLKMGEASHAIDNVGTCKLIDACKKAGVPHFVLISSILTNGRAWGQESSPGFRITNAFGGVLDEKLVAEKYLRDSGLTYVIVRPAGLRDKVEGQITVSAEDTLNSGEVARASVAQVCVEAALAPPAKSKVIEIVETEAGTPKEAWFA